MTEGKVWLVGAGPGDTGLITVKGEQVLKEAQVVVYDHLVNPDLLARYGDGKRFINVGKQAGRHLIPQQEIQEILVREAREGNKVVRLKGGDPFLFGRGGEEAMVLAKEGIPFEVVPGVTSALSVPAYAGIPVTHRDFCSSLHIITGHAKAGAKLTIDFEALKRTGGTLVFLMGVTALPAICQGLLDAGMEAEMPAAVIERGTTPRQRKLISTLGALPQAAAEAKIESPAIIVVGKVCTLSEKFDWFDALPLKGREIVVTRPRERMGALSEKLRALGAAVTEYPCIETVERVENPALDQAMDHLAQYRYLVFPSPAGPEIFMKRLLARGRDARALAGLKIAAIGPKTAHVLTRFGLKADLVPAVYDSDHLAEAMAEVAGPVLLCRASRGSDALPKIFSAKGIPFDDIPCYDTRYETPDAATILPLLARDTLVTFTSASTVEGFVKSLRDVDLSHVLGVCIGEKTAEKARGYGIAVRVAREATIESLINCIKEV